ncbi:hypothetical protein C8Q80DRAFT_1356408 [Daedaleopsis nitida]|nr:hypothetical protein C8Q80DRAFT_1356408 [Daedaleopsis nitida]
MELPSNVGAALLKVSYVPPLSTPLRENHILHEASQLHVQAPEELKKIRDLTLSFDGKLRKPRGVYTVTVTTPTTGNTRKACINVMSKFPHIQNLQDCCHQINLALLQINELNEFKEMIQDVKAILMFMH